MRVMTIGGREQELAAAAEPLETKERRLRLFRRSRALAVLGALILAGAIAAAVVAITSGFESAVTVAPDSVAVLDKGGKLVGDVPIGGRPVSLMIDDDAVWVANADDGTVLRIDPDSYGRGNDRSRSGRELGCRGLRIGMGCGWQRRACFASTPTRTPWRRRSAGKVDPLRPDPVFFVAAGLEAVWITQGEKSFESARGRMRSRRESRSRHRLPPRRPLSSFPSASTPGRNVWVPTLDERLVRIDEGTGAISATTQLPGGGLSPDVKGGCPVADRPDGDPAGLEVRPEQPRRRRRSRSPPRDLKSSLSPSRRRRAVWASGPREKPRLEDRLDHGTGGTGRDRRVPPDLDRRHARHRLGRRPGVHVRERLARGVDLPAMISRRTLSTCRTTERGTFGLTFPRCTPPPRRSKTVLPPVVNVPVTRRRIAATTARSKSITALIRMWPEVGLVDVDPTPCPVPSRPRAPNPHPPATLKMAAPFAI